MILEKKWKKRKKKKKKMALYVGSKKEINPSINVLIMQLQ